MKKKAWLPILTLTTLNPFLAHGAGSKILKCTSAQPEVNLSFYKPHEYGYSLAVRMAPNGDDQSIDPVFAAMKVQDWDGDFFVTEKAFRVNLYYYYSPDDSPIINEDVGILEGRLDRDGKWTVTFTASNKKKRYNKGPVGQEIALDCKDQEQE